MIFFDVYASCFKETRVCTRVAIYNTHVHLKYMTFYIKTRVRDCCLYTLRTPPENVKKIRILKFG